MRPWAPLPKFYWLCRGLGGFGAAFLVLTQSRRLWRSFFGTAAVSATLGAVFLVLPQSRRLWRGFFGTAAVSAALARLFWYCRGLGGFGAVFLVLPRSRRLWRSFFDVAAASLAYSFHWFSREKYCRKNTAAFAEVLRAGRPLPRRRSFEQAETSVHEKTGGTTACPLFLADCTGNSVPPARQPRAAKAAAECSAAPVCFFLPRRKSGGRLNVQHSLRRSPLGR